MAKKRKRAATRGRSGKSVASANKRANSGKGSARVGKKRRRVRNTVARLDISVHDTPTIENRGASKMAVSRLTRRAIL